MASARVSTTETTISVSVSGLPSTAGTVWIDIRSPIDDRNGITPSNSSASHTFTGLTPGTTYRVYVYGEGGVGEIYNSLVTTDYYIISVTIQFNANGGIVPPVPETWYQQSQSTSGTITKNLPSDVPTKVGYQFDYWYHSSYPNVHYNPGQQCGFEATTQGRTVTLVAHWTQVYTCTASIVFDAQGGSGEPNTINATTESTTSSATVYITIPSTIPTKAGYSFKNWKLRGYETYYNPGQTNCSFTATSPASTKYLDAQWEADSGTHVYYDGHWWRAQPYVYSNGHWYTAQAYVYHSNGWWRA